MFKDLRKLAKNQKGFSLTEVMIGMMILTVAIVSATNLLVGLISTNKNIVGNLQAYYFAQEGIESVRNIRDTNWMNNIDWQGSPEVLGRFETNTDYVVGLDSGGWKNSSRNDQEELAGFATWDFDLGNKEELCLQMEDNAHFFASCDLAISEERTGYTRTVSVLPYCDDFNESLCDDSVLVKSIVEWEESGREQELVLEEVLTDWKGGAL